MSTYTFSVSSSDCYGNVFGSLYTGTADLMIAGMSAPLDANVRTWIPFVVNMPNSKKIISATLRWVASDTQGAGFNVTYSCEAVDNATAPADATALYAKTLTAGYAAAIPAYTAGVEYSIDITTDVQTVLNRAGWAYGNTLAVVVENNSGSGSNRRVVAASENGSYASPKLDIVVTYVPKGSGLI